MKVKISILIVFSILRFSAYAQIIDPKDEAENQGVKRTNSHIENGIDKGFDKLEDGIGSLFSKKKKDKEPEEQKTSNRNNSQSNSQEQQKQNNSELSEVASETPMVVTWNKYDFIPGDEVIFEDGPSIDEENGEFPSRWDLVEGNVEIANVNGDNVVYSVEHGTIVPYLKNASEDYLPEVFTIEFDAFFGKGHSGRFFLTFRDDKNQRNIGPSDRFYIYVNSIDFLESSASYPEKGANNDKKGGWRHISIAFTKGKVKAYMDDTRLINIPHYEGNPTGVTVQMERYSGSDYQKFFKNFRIAKGGVKYYDRVLNDGKIICNGIRFNSGEATLKPESMGPINEIYELMNKHLDLKFSVEGHTDGDGNDELNQLLSENRAQTVMEKLIAMGIPKDRLISKGLGESMPIGNNSTPEGKANNRRVEFVKF